MTRDEWETIALLIENCWRGEFDDTRSASYLTMLQQFDHGQVMAALRILTERGKPFVPSVPEIVQAIRDASEPALPAFSEVWAALQTAMRERSVDDAVKVMGERCGPVAAAFMESEGVGRLKHIEFFNPDFGEMRVKELEHRWSDFSARADDRARLGLALGAGARREGQGGFGRLSTGGLLEPPDDDFVGDDGSDNQSDQED